MYNYSIVISMYKHAHHIYPRILDSIVIKNNEKNMHNTNTRQSKYFHKPELKLSLSQRTINYKGAAIWNNIYSKFKTNVAYNQFKSSLKLIACHVEYLIFAVICVNFVCP